MKTRRLSTILTSAYLSAMLASSVAPIRRDATLAAAIDPLAAQKALQNAVSGLDAAGWMASSTSGASSAATQLTPKVVPITTPPKTEPVMTEELLARLIKYTRNVEGTGTVSAKICKVLDLCDGTKSLTVKLAGTDVADVSHYIGLPVNADSKDVLIMMQRGTFVEAYLTDKTGRLRAAAVLENGTARLITNEKAAENYKKELSFFAGEAASLPPAGTAPAVNS